MSLLVYLDIHCKHSCKYTEIKCHIPSIFLFKLFCLILSSNSSSVIWGHSFRLLYSWDSPYLVPYYTCTTLIKVPWGLMFCLCLWSSFVSDISLTTCLRLIASTKTYVFFCASWSWFLEMQFFWPTIPISYHLILFCIRGVLLFVIMLPWFDGVSYVFNICTYVLGGCSGWVPMHFGEMDHLPYKHSSFHSYFGCKLPCSIDQLFRLCCLCHLYLQVQLFSSWFE